jgi:CRISPR/Cas system-associated exonuclease Cas4 (RecB family)
MITKCPRQYWYRYVLGWKEMPKAAMEFGSSYHDVLEESYGLAIEGHSHLLGEEAKEAFLDNFAERAETVDWNVEDSGYGLLVDKGTTLVATYVEEFAPKRNPVAVEYEFEIYMPEEYEIYAPFVGRLDFLGRDHILEHKTAARSYSQSSVDSSMQVDAYYIVYRHLFNQYPSYFTFDVAVKTKVPKIQYDVVTTRTPYQLEIYYERIQEAQALVEKEQFPRTNPDNWYCSAKWCGYWEHCMKGTPLHQLRLRNLVDEEKYGGGGVVVDDHEGL